MAKTACALLGLVATAGAAPHDDLVRARTKVPRPEYAAGTFSEMGEILSKHLRRNFARVEDCGNFTVPRLRATQERLFEAADAELVAIYAGSQDGRRERHESPEALRKHWDQLVEQTPEEAQHVLRDGLCHEVVMRFVHHTTEATKEALAADPSFVLPALSTRRHGHDGRPETLEAHKEYTADTSCQAGHSRLVPLPHPETSQNCNQQLVQSCGKRGQLHKGKCGECIQAHASDLGSCRAGEAERWCDHPDACIGADECPVWPTEFSAPFTLHSTLPPINGAKCDFYYKYTAQKQVQLVDYHEKCFPFVGVRSFFHDLPCKLYFNPQGIYLSQPGRVDCCLFKAGVGAVPPEFLQSYKRVGQDVNAPDMYGNQVKCDKWEGPLQFKYWTVGHNDALYKNFGHDIVFQDGPTGVTWRWGNFKVGPQDDSLFTLPSSQCSQPCPKVLEAEEIEALHQDPHVKRAFAHHGVALPATNLVV